MTPNYMRMPERPNGVDCKSVIQEFESLSSFQFQCRVVDYLGRYPYHAGSSFTLTNGCVENSTLTTNRRVVGYSPTVSHAQAANVAQLVEQQKSLFSIFSPLLSFYCILQMQDLPYPSPQ